MKKPNKEDLANLVAIKNFMFIHEGQTKEIMLAFLFNQLLDFARSDEAYTKAHRENVCLNFQLLHGLISELQQPIDQK